MPSVEIVSVVVGGKRYRSWKSVSVNAALREAARSFRLDVAAEAGALATAWTFKAGAEVEIYFNDDLVLKGYVDRYQPRISHDDAQVTISGRSKSADAIDSAAVHRTGRFENKTMEEIGGELLSVVNVPITVGEGVSLRTIPHYQITPGETMFRAMERLARQEGVALMGRADGGIEIAKGGRKRHAGKVAEGENLKVGEADHNWSNRHSRYIVRGQRPSGSGPEALEIEAAVNDAGVNRYRPTVIVVEEDTNRERARTRARNRRNRAAGNSLKASITLQGFRDEAGAVWEPNRLIFLDSPFLQVSQDMLIESVTFSQDANGGSLTKLSLVDPKAYDAQNQGGGQRRGRRGRRRGRSNTGPAWQIGSD